MGALSIGVCLTLSLIASACDEEPEGPRVTVHTCTGDGSTSSSRVRFYDPARFLVGEYPMNGNTNTVSNPMPVGGSVELDLYSGGDGSGDYDDWRLGALDGVTDGDDLDFRHFDPMPVTCRVREIPEVTLGSSSISWSDPRAYFVDARIITETWSDPPPAYLIAKTIRVDGSNATSVTGSASRPWEEITVTVVECDGETYNDIKVALARRAGLGC